MSNGYRPAPLDLSDVKLSAGQEVLVDKLAENAHNVWAKDRIKQGWTYGIQQVRSIILYIITLLLHVGNKLESTNFGQHLNLDLDLVDGKFVFSNLPAN